MNRWRRGVAGTSASWWFVSVVFLGAGALSLLLVGRVVHGQATEVVEQQARTSLAGSASSTALFLDEQLDGVVQVLNAYGTRRSLLAAVESAGGAGRTELDRQVRELLAARTDVLDAAGIADATGRMLSAPEAPADVGSDFSARDWYLGVRRTGTTYVSSAFVGASAGSALAISVATPVKDRAGTLAAVIVVDYKISDLQQYVARVARQQGVDITVTDQDGVVIARPGAPPTTLQSWKDDPRIRAALAGRAGVTDRVPSAGGRGVLAAHAPVARVGWAVVAELPREEAYAPAEQVRDRALLVTATVTPLLLLAGLLLAGTLRAREQARDEADRLTSVHAASSARLSTLMRIAPAGIVELDAAGGLETANDQWTVLTGLNQKQAAGQGWAAAVHADDVERVRTEWRAKALAGETYETTVRLVGPDGQVSSVHVRTAPVHEHGRLTGHLAILSDITALRAAQEAEKVIAAERIEAQERAALAEAVHDDSLQLIVAALLRIDSLQAAVPAGEAAALEQIAELLEQAIEHLRQLIVSLVPPDLTAGLGVTLRRLAEGLFVGTPTEVSVVGALDPPLADSAKVAAYRIAREALVNARKHARASTVVLDMTVRADSVVLTVRDDGVGADSVSPVPGHLGLETMHRRAAAEGADLQISAAPGKGVQVTLALPRPPVGP